MTDKRRKAAQAKKAKKEQRFKETGTSTYQQKRAQFGKNGKGNPRSPFYQEKLKKPFSPAYNEGRSK